VEEKFVLLSWSDPHGLGLRLQFDCYLRMIMAPIEIV